MFPDPNHEKVYEGQLLQVYSQTKYFKLIYYRNVAKNMKFLGDYSSLIYFYGKGQIEAVENTFYQIGMIHNEQI